MNNINITIKSKLTEWEWWSDKNTTRLYTYLLCEAYDKETIISGIYLTAGSLMTTLSKLVEEVGIGQRSIKTSLDNLVSSGIITIDTYNKNTIITLLGYCTNTSNIAIEAQNKPLERSSQEIEQVIRKRQTTLSFDDFEPIKELEEIANVQKRKVNLISEPIYREDGSIDPEATITALGADECTTQRYVHMAFEYSWGLYTKEHFDWLRNGLCEVLSQVDVSVNDILIDCANQGEAIPRIDRFKDKLPQQEQRNAEISSSTNQPYKPKKGKFNFLEALISIGVDEEIASDWVSLRKQKKASNSLTAFNCIKTAIENITKRYHITPTDTIRICVERSWMGCKESFFDNIRFSDYGIK